MLAILWLLSTQFFTTSWISSLIGRFFLRRGGEGQKRQSRKTHQKTSFFYSNPLSSSNVHKAALIYPWVSHLVHVLLAIQQSKDCSRQWIQTWGCFSHMICSNQVNFLSERTTWKTHTPISVRWYLHHQVSIDYCTYQTKIYCNRLQRGNLACRRKY